MSRSPLSIGIACYPTFGGSGVIATEVGMEMARRGHKVHVMSYDVPRRLDQFLENIYFHEVEIASYPLFDHQPYALALASKMYEVADQQNLDVLHVHYAIPHAVSAFLAVQMLDKKRPKIITTLHGTDITLVGNDRTYLPITRLSIQKSDGVTAVSRYLKQATYDKLNINTSFPIEVIPNFVDLDVFTPVQSRRDLVMKQLCGKRQRPIITHVSNFRPVKRIMDVIHVFAEVRKQIDCALVMAGDGPERSNAERLVRELKLCPDVCFLGKQTAVNEVLWCSDLLLMPSQSESFGLGALEAMACAVPVVASNVGGLPEVVKDGVCGYLCDLGDIAAMASKSAELLKDPEKRKNMGAAGREIASSQYEMRQVVSQYEEYYYRMVEA